jgi:succinate dehydrogenase / fumarate reductase, flavoprotein subunit
LLNGKREPFEAAHAAADERSDGTYKLTRDLATYAITKEVEAGRGTPSGGAYLSFRHVPEIELRRAFGPVIDRLAANGIDLTQCDIEVAPIAHYHMGGVQVSAALQTCVPGLYVCGEAIGGSNGANRLSGNAISEAFVFGARAGRAAVNAARSETSAAWPEKVAAASVDLLRAARRWNGPNLAQMVVDLQDLMSDQVGPLRTQEKLEGAIATLGQMSFDLGEVPQSSGKAFDPVLLDWLDLRNMILAARTVAAAALARTESRGAHQRDDYLHMDEHWMFNQVVKLSNGRLDISRSVPPQSRAAA